MRTALPAPRCGSTTGPPSRAVSSISSNVVRGAGRGARVAKRMLTALLFAATFALLHGARVLALPDLRRLLLPSRRSIVHPPSRWWGAYLPRPALVAARCGHRSALALCHPQAPPAASATSVVDHHAGADAAGVRPMDVGAGAVGAGCGGSLRGIGAVRQVPDRLLPDLPPGRHRQKRTDDLARARRWLRLPRASLPGGRRRDSGIGSDGVGGPGIDDANSLGMVLATGVVVALVALLTQNGWRRIACALALPLILNGLCSPAAAARSSACVAGALVLVVLRRRSGTAGCSGRGRGGGRAGSVSCDRQDLHRSHVHDLEVTLAGRGRRPMRRAREPRRARRGAARRCSPTPDGLGPPRHGGAQPAVHRRARWLTADARRAAARSSHNTFMTAADRAGHPGRHRLPLDSCCGARRS